MKQRNSTVEIPANWDKMTDEQRYQWVETALGKLADDVGVQDRRASKKR